jgi:polyhydroxybutyrate depolymerase
MYHRRRIHLPCGIESSRSQPHVYSLCSLNLQHMADRSPVRAVLTVVLAVVLVALVASEPGYYAHETAAGDYLKKIDVGGRHREYRLHLPSGYDGTQRLPLLLAFHGSSATASVLEHETSLDEVADSLGFIVAYPEGLYRSWNIGECCRYAFAMHVGDVAFVNSLLDHLEANLRVDATRVFAAGYSDGGTLSFLLACSLPTRIAAVAAVSATLFDPLPACNISRPISVLIIHGTADTNIPYNGQPGATADARTQHLTLSARDVVQFWVNRSGCVAAPRTTRAGRVIRSEYDCSHSARVLFYTIEGGEHGWPGGGRGWIFSPVPATDMDATDSIVSFFLHRRTKAPVAPATERSSVVPALR